jgi:hypothetical protein
LDYVRARVNRHARRQRWPPRSGCIREHWRMRECSLPDYSISHWAMRSRAGVGGSPCLHAGVSRTGRAAAGAAVRARCPKRLGERDGDGAARVQRSLMAGVVDGRFRPLQLMGREVRQARRPDSLCGIRSRYSRVCRPPVFARHRRFSGNTPSPGLAVRGPKTFRSVHLASR